MAAGTPAHLVEGRDDVRAGWLESVEVVEVTAVASAPGARSMPSSRRCERGYRDVRTVEVARENQVFSIPRELDHVSAERARGTT